VTASAPASPGCSPGAPRRWRSAVEAATARMPGRRLGDDSVFGWPGHRLRHTESFVCTEIGDVVRAAAAQERALEICPASQAGNRAMVQMHRAACLVAEGDIATGLHYVTDALDTVPTDQHDQPLYEVARRTVARLPPDRFMNHPRSRETFSPSCDRLPVGPRGTRAVVHRT
jgi:hypothetical protein